MTWLRDRLPSSALHRVRMAALAFSVVNALTLFPLVLSLSSDRRWLGAVAQLLVLADVVLTYVRRRVYWSEPLVAGVLLFSIGICVDQSSAVIGVAMSLVVSQSLYGSGRSVAVRAAAVLAAGAGALSLPLDFIGQPAGNQGVPVLTVLLVPVLFAGLMWVLGNALARQEQAGAHEALLVRVGARLLGSKDVLAVRAIMAISLHELCKLTPGLGLIGIQRDGQRAVLTAAYGLPDAPVGGTISSAFLAGCDADDVDIVHRFAGGTAAIDALLGRRRSGWLGLGLGTFEPDRFLLASSSSPGRLEGIVDVLRTMFGQLSLAEASCRAHAELTQLAHHDQLTALPNRRAFFGALASAVDAADDRAGCALMIIDLDDFKEVNDTFGHSAGDALLIELAARMKQATDDHGVTSRFGGDEFAVLLTGLTDPSEADLVANRIRERLRAPVHLSTGTVTVGASIGIVNATPGATAGDLMRCADIAMYSAKARGKNRVERFAHDRHGGIAQVRQLEDHLAQAVQRGEIVLYYQPFVDLKTGRCQGVEALARWQHPSLGLLAPEAFIPLAERHGHIGELGAHVLVTACRQLAAWSADDAKAKMRVSVNVSIRQLTSPGFDQVVRAALDDSGLAPDRLFLEFVESDDLEHELPRQQLAAIAAMGVRIALDDFGAGHTSLARLRAMPLQQLKIDRRLLIDAEGTEKGDVGELIMSVSRFLELETVAKSVETAEHAHWARRAGMTMAQGLFFGPPVPVDLFDSWLAHAYRTTHSHLAM